MKVKLPIKDAKLQEKQGNEEYKGYDSMFCQV